MNEDPSSNREHLYEILSGFDRAMLVTRTGDGRLRSRPMAIAEVERDGNLYFATSLASPKVDELEGDPHVNVSLQGKTQFVSLTGRAEVVRDRALIEKCWRERWRVWFPHGKDDPELCLLQVHVEEGHYWDNEGSKGLRYLFEAAKAYVTGTTPKTDSDQYAGVRVQS